MPNFGDAGVEYPIEFGWGEKLAPRLGFTYDPFSDGRTKIYGSWGKYFDVMKYELPRGSFGGDKWVDYWFTWDNPDVNVNSAPAAAPAPTPSPSSRSAPAARCSKCSTSATTPPRTSTSSSIPNLKPMEEHEFQLGANREFNWGTHGQRRPRRALHPQGSEADDRGRRRDRARHRHAVLHGQPRRRDHPDAERSEHSAVPEGRSASTTASNSPWSAGSPATGALFASYTYSRLYGNYSGLASSDEDGRTAPNVNRFFDQIVMTFDQNRNLVYGRLGTDRPHQLKAQLMYRTPWKMTVGLNQRVASGIPISEEFQIVRAAIPFFPNGRGNLGRTPTFSQSDLSLIQDVRFGGQTLQFQVTVLNLFDQDTVTRLDNTRFAGTSTLPIDDQPVLQHHLGLRGAAGREPGVDRSEVPAGEPVPGSP